MLEVVCVASDEIKIVFERSGSDEGVSVRELSSLSQPNGSISDGIRDREHNSGSEEDFDIGLVLRSQFMLAENFDPGRLGDSEWLGEDVRAQPTVCGLRGINHDVAV